MVASRFFPKFMEGMPKDLSGKVFVITGTTSGTGYVAARTVASLGGEVVLLNRPSERATASLVKLQEEVGKKDLFVPIDCDLQSFASVRKAIAAVKAKYTEIYCLCCNAGIMATPDQATVDGYDTQMQTNHLSHFLLTEDLMPLLEKGAKKYGDARQVNHSSVGRLHTVHNGLEEKYFEKNGGNLGGNEVKMMDGACFHRYFQTKLANSVHTQGLHEKLQAKQSKVRAVCAHPGGSTTGLNTHLKFGWFWDTILYLLGDFVMQSAEDGATGLIKAMIDPEAQSGVLYGPKNSGTRGWPVPNPPKDFETDPKAIAMLWRTSEAATM